MNEEDKLYKDNNSGITPDGDADRVNNFQEDFFNFDNDSSMEDADEDLLALLDMISAQDNNTPYEEDLLSVHPTEVNEEAYASNKETQSEDIVSLDDFDSNDFDLNVFDNLDEEAKDDNLVDSILNLGNDQESEKLDTKETSNDSINNVGDVFSNVLSAVDLLDDETEAHFAQLTQDHENQEQEEKKDNLDISKKPFGKKINKNEDIKALEKEAKAKAKKEAKEKKAKEKAAKAKKNNKSSKAKTVPVNPNSDEQAELTKANEEKSKKAKKEKKKTEKKKAVKKKSEAKIKPSKKAKEIVDEITEDIEEYKVSKLAIIFIATFIILVSGFVILGTDSYSYSLNLKNAKTNFDRKRYTEAYYEIYGLDIRKQDKVTYDKIMTVMYINKEINSYNNYKSMNKYPEALDSLLKGLERYGRYISRAEELGIKEDLNSLKATIVDELGKTYQITEEEAQSLIEIEDQSKYSINVINIALENVKQVASE